MHEGWPTPPLPPPRPLALGKWLKSFHDARSVLAMSWEWSSCKGESAPRTQAKAAMEKNVDAL